MRREQFESRIRSLLPGATDEAVASWVGYAQELDRDEIEAESDLYDAAYVELSLIKKHQGVEVATRLFNYGEQFTFNYFELRGAASKLEEGWSLDDISRYAVENGCDPTPEEAEESQKALRELKSSGQQAFEMQMM